MNSKEVTAVIEETLKRQFLSLERLDALLEDDTTFDQNVELLLVHPTDAFHVEIPDESSGPLSGTLHPLNEVTSSLSGAKAPLDHIGAILGARLLEASAIRQGMAREEEYRFAKRLEFFRARLIKAIKSKDFPSKTKESLLRSIACLGRSRTGGICLICEKGGPCPRHELKKDDVHACCMAYNRCRAVFVERNLHLVVNVTRAYRTYGVPVMDLVQEGNAALIRAVEKYDWRKQVRLQTYAEFWIRQAVERAISANKWIVRVPNYIQQKMRRFRREGILPGDQSHISTREVSEAFDMSSEVAGRLLETERGHVSLDAAASENSFSNLADLAAASPEEVVPQEEYDNLKTKLQNMLKDLTELERTIIRHRFGMEGAEMKTLEELGRMMNVSRERIRQIQIRTLQKLQKPKHLKQLKSFL